MPRKKQRFQWTEQDETVTLTDGDLEKIVDAVTMAAEDMWVALEKQQKVVVYTIQAKLCALQLKIDTLQTNVT